MSVLKTLEELVISQFQIVKTIATLFKLEARLAKISIAPLIITTCLMLIILSCVWMIFMALVGVAVYTAIHNVLFALLIVLICNILALCLLCMMIRHNINSMGFEKTRAYFTQLKEPSQHDIQKGSSGGNFSDK